LYLFDKLLGSRVRDIFSFLSKNEFTANQPQRPQRKRSPVRIPEMEILIKKFAEFVVYKADWKKT